MNVENQYIELYHAHAQTICNHSATILNAPRDAAMACFEQIGLPTKEDEEYKYSDVRAAFAPDYGLNLNRVESAINPYDVFKCNVPSLSTQLLFMVNDSFYNKKENTTPLPNGILAGSLRQYAESHPELVEPYYGKIAPIEANGAVALNTAFAQDGFFLYIPRNVVMERPLQLINILRSQVDYMVNRRLLIVVEEGAQAKLLVCDHALDCVNYLSNQVVEIHVGEGAVFDYYDLEENKITSTRICNNHLSVAAKANVLVNGITLNCGNTRNNYHLTFTGEHAEAKLCGMTIADGKQRVDNHIFVDHAVPNCTSNELFKYILNNEAKGVFTGRILVRKDAQKTAAFQTNRNLCIAPTARMYTKPQLEIYADDVQCNHGATIGQLDTNALFYMQARGISKTEARMLLMSAFANDVVENVRLEALKERLKQLVDNRLRGKDLSKCSKCHICD